MKIMYQMAKQTLQHYHSYAIQLSTTATRVYVAYRYLFTQLHKEKQDNPK